VLTGKRKPGRFQMDFGLEFKDTKVKLWSKTGIENFGTKLKSLTTYEEGDTTLEGQVVTGKDNFGYLCLML
jgi:hypothetical protein